MKTGAKSIALFGGTFDPPHLAHRQIIEYLLQLEKYDEIWVFPSHRHPFKKPIASFEDRLAMCEIALADLGERVKILDLEKNLSGYTIDLIQSLKKDYPDFHWTFIAGSDVQSELKKWKRSEELRQWMEFEFLPRGQENQGQFLPICSRDLREKLAKGEKIGEDVPKNIEDYIQEHQLYPRKLP